MERLKELINQLTEQFDRKAEPSQMLETARFLEAELRQLASQPVAGRVMPTKIAVMMPSATKIYTAQPAAAAASHPYAPAVSAVPPAEDPSVSRPASPAVTEQKSAPGYQQAPAPSQDPAPVYQPVSAPAASYQPAAVSNQPATNYQPASAPGYQPAAVSAPVYQPVSAPAASYQPAATPSQGPSPSYQPESAPSPAPVNPALAVVEISPYAPVPTVASIASAVSSGVNGSQKAQERGQWPFDPLAEKPTDRYTLSQKTREVNDVIGANGKSSLNDKLKTDIADLKSTLNDTPVRDLKKAIGVNDRYVFINQLFRGDEVMYERSLKTINAFRILPEAEYWMERELKVKLGWDENRDATRQFYQLVKRRFS